MKTTSYPMSRLILSSASKSLGTWTNTSSSLYLHSPYSCVCVWVCVEGGSDKRQRSRESVEAGSWNFRKVSPLGRRSEFKYWLLGTISLKKLYIVFLLVSWRLSPPTHRQTTAVISLAPWEAVVFSCCAPCIAGLAVVSLHPTATYDSQRACFG